jgi:hypothetical protein
MIPLKTKLETERTQGDYISMSHSLLLNHLQTEIKKSKHKTPAHQITDYLTKRIFAWFYFYVTSRFGPNHKYKTYKTPDNGIYPLGEEVVTIALAADWATNTPESKIIAERMYDHKPDYTIHLGDTYYVGAPPEIKANFIYKDSPWKRGTKGSFAILGNHEMYARGDAFFKHLLPTLGLKNRDGGFEGQKAGFFCLENDKWRILGLDTGYHSIGKIPLLELLPWFSPNCHFDQLLMDWLRDQLKLNDPEDKRGLLILTHHQYITAFSGQGEYTIPAKQIAKLIGKDRPVLWLWGHEHKLSVFEKAQVGEGVTAYGRCIGHGGMPVELGSSGFKRSDDKHGSSKLVYVDKRRRIDEPGCVLGYNGYVLLKLLDKRLDIFYHDANGEILSEFWIANTQTGMIKGCFNESADPAFNPEENKNWSDAVK